MKTDVSPLEVFLSVVAAEGPLVPVAVAADFAGISPQAVWDRVHRGTLPSFYVWGRAFVPLVKLTSTQVAAVRASLGSGA